MKIELAIARLALVTLSGCATAPRYNNETPVPAEQVIMADEIDTSFRNDKGFIPQEAQQLLELCLDLNNRGDVAGNPALYQAHIGHWQPAIEKWAPAALPNGLPDMGPFQNAWMLWRRDTGENDFAVVARGTKSTLPSALDDALATTIGTPAIIPAWKRGYLKFRLALWPGAETHLGFTYGLAVILFTKEDGILDHLRQLPAKSRLYITGHSQGAGIGALLHAFLHYAINDPKDQYGLRDKHFELKSYFYAQPKPGNWEFSMDFARYAASKQASYTINNLRDWVPQAPITRQVLSEPFGAFDAEVRSSARSQTVRVIAALADRFVQLGRGLRHFAADFVENKFDPKMQSYAETDGQFDTAYKHPLEPGQLARFSPADSLDYSHAGNIIPLIGENPCALKYQDRSPIGDFMCQHHLVHYRDLLNAAYPPPSDPNPQAKPPN